MIKGGTEGPCVLVKSNEAPVDRQKAGKVLHATPAQRKNRGASHKQTTQQMVLKAGRQQAFIRSEDAGL